MLEKNPGARVRQPARVLVIDDNDATRYAVTRTLRAAGFETLEGASGGEALQLATRQPDLVLLDIHLPDIDGFEVCRRLKSDPRTTDLPVMHLSASYVRSEDMVHGLEQGADAYLTQPVEPSVLVATVRALLRVRAAEESLKALNATLEDRVAQRTRELQQLAVELTRAEQSERRRLAQILHDDLQQILVAARLRLDTLRRRRPDLDPDLDGLDTLVREAIAGARAITVQLSPPVLFERGLNAALEWLAQRMFELHRVTVAFTPSLEAEPEREELGALLFEVARELLFNVAKHAHVNAASVTLSREADGSVALRVVDAGAGFDPALSGGPGFGLPSVRHRLELVGGTLRIDSAPGAGTRTEAVVPGGGATADAAALPPPETRGEGEEGAPPAALPGDGRIRLLIVDDHEILATGLAGLMDGQPDIHVVGRAASGLAAIQENRRLRPDVVLMDVSMPGMSGIEATRRLVAERPDVRVIGLSMHEASDAADAMTSAGAVAYLCKSGPLDDLLSTIRGAVGRPPA